MSKLENLDPSGLATVTGGQGFVGPALYPQPGYGVRLDSGSYVQLPKSGPGSVKDRPPPGAMDLIAPTR